MQIAMLVADGGDGSTSIRFFRDTLLAEKVAEDERWCEEFGTNEGSPTLIEISDSWSPIGGWDDKEYVGLYEV